MIALFQIINFVLLIGYIVLFIAALVHLHRQSLSERDLFLWKLIVIFVPLGAVLAFIFFPRHPRN